MNLNIGVGNAKAEKNNKHSTNSAFNDPAVYFSYPRSLNVALTQFSAVSAIPNPVKPLTIEVVVNPGVKSSMSFCLCSY